MEVVSSGGGFVGAAVGLILVGRQAVAMMRMQERAESNFVKRMDILLNKKSLFNG
jgi:hypothetical protein